MLDPDMPTQELLLHMGEMTAQEIRTARAAIRWANHAIVSGSVPEGARLRVEHPTEAIQKLATMRQSYDKAMTND